MRIQVIKPVSTPLLAEQLAKAYSTQIVLSWLSVDGEYVWIDLPDELDPGPALQVIAAHDAQAQSGRSKLRAAIVQRVQSTVGIRVDQLDAAQLKALVIALLWNAGAIDPDTLAINQLDDWI